MPLKARRARPCVSREPLTTTRISPDAAFRQFKKRQGQTSPVGEFEQRFARSQEPSHATGDYRFLAGDALAMSCSFAVDERAGASLPRRLKRARRT